MISTVPPAATHAESTERSELRAMYEAAGDTGALRKLDEVERLEQLKASSAIEFLREHRTLVVGVAAMIAVSFSLSVTHEPFWGSHTVRVAGMFSAPWLVKLALARLIS